MKIKLIKPHWHLGVYHEAGTEIDVDKATYDFIVEVNKKDRADTNAEEQKVKDLLTGKTKPGAQTSGAIPTAPAWVPPAEVPDPAAKVPNFGEQPQPAMIPGIGKAAPQEKNLAEKAAIEGNKQ